MFDLFRIARRAWLLLLLTATAGVASPDTPVVLSISPEVRAAPDRVSAARIDVSIEEGYHIYSTRTQIDEHGLGPSATSLRLEPAELASVAGALRPSAERNYYDPNFQCDVATLQGKAYIEFDLKVSAGVPPGRHSASVILNFQACTTESCLPPQDLKVAFTIVVVAPSTESRMAEDPRWAEAKRQADGLAAKESKPGERDTRMQRYAALAWELYTAHPDDPRRWAAFEKIERGTLRYIIGYKDGYIEHPAEDKILVDTAARDIWLTRIARVEADASAAADVPDSFRELIAGKKISAMVLPYTNAVLPADWMERLVPPIEGLAKAFPEGSAAFVYFSRLISAVEAQAPAQLPALVQRLTWSPNARVRELGATRERVLLAMAHPLALNFTALDGRRVNTAEWHDRVIIVDFWATWCVPCIQSMPHLKELYTKYHGRGLEIVSISVDQANARGALEKLVSRLGLPWPQCFDGVGPRTPYAVLYGVQPIPHLLIAGKDGYIVAVNPTASELEAQIEKLLKL